MKLTVQLKLVPTPEQHAALLETMHAFNAAASYAADVGFADHVFTQQSIHRRCYRELRDRFGLSSQMAVRAIGKAVETFRREKKVCPIFRPEGAMTYDERLLGWKGPAHVSLLTLHGREIVAMVYGEYQAGFLPRLKGQVDLVYRDGTFYLYATIEVPEDTPIEPTRFLGVDFGITNIATDSDGNAYTGDAIEGVRHRAATARQTYQSTHTKSAKRRLKKMAGKQARFQRWANHGLAKRLVQYAKDTKAALVLEDLTGIRDRMTVRKQQRAKQHNWSFRQLREFLSYKAQQLGVPVVFVNPRNTSRTCAKCGDVDQRNRRSQTEFSCLRCEHKAHADHNAARNLATRGAVSRPDLCAPWQGQLAFSW
ncbi:MAG: IS200/IS605 family element transposase accessory protein TnpB [Candidatus Tectomicrobia bacterium]|nr:IS200/IS605 family element transposase accessory protein TnpB [Candidatus Tectomicrobia bacterium]